MIRALNITLLALVIGPPILWFTFTVFERLYVLSTL